MKNLTLKNKYRFGFPKKSGLYDPQFEKDSCGVGLVANIKGIPSREIMDDAFHVNSRWITGEVADSKKILEMVQVS